MTWCGRWATSPVSPDPPSQDICKDIDEGVAEFLSRPLDHACFPYLFVDATYVDVRVNHRVVSQALVVATGVSAQGHREILSMAVGDAETTDFWTSFLRSLRERGLRVTTDQDPDLTPDFFVG